MHVFIDNKSGTPIYDQIYTQIKSQIINGSLKEDEMLPSIRGLAKDLRISFITTKHAYDELEKEGFLYTVPGKGCFVAPKNVELLREENLKKIEAHMEQIAVLAASCNLTKEELIAASVTSNYPMAVIKLIATRKNGFKAETIGYVEKSDVPVTVAE